MTSPGQEETPPKKIPFGREVVLLLKSILPALILVGVAFAFYWILATAPKAEKAKHPRKARLVTVVDVKTVSHQITIAAQGTVEAAREVTLNPQVSGEIVEVSPALEPGGFISAGELIVRIDASDYELAREMRQADVARMEASRVLEEANRNVAKREYEVLGEDLAVEEKALVLREPQLASASAQVDSARAMLGDARLDLDRAIIAAPFDAQVVEKHVDLGTRLSTQMAIVRLVGTETYWISLSVPQGDLRWLEFPDDSHAGSRVVLTLPTVWGADRSREGRIIRLLPELSAGARMARVLVTVDDPLCLKPENRDKPRLLVGQYLLGEIEGRTLEDVVVVPRELLRNGDRVWLMKEDNRLEVRDVDVVYRGLDEVVVAVGLTDEERIVSTDIATVADGMELRLGDTERGGGRTGDGAGRRNAAVQAEARS